MVLPLKNGRRLMKNFPKQSSIYWFDPEPVKGSELRKIRPCIVVSPDEMNESLRTVLVVPLTSTVKPWPFRMVVTVLGRKSSAACDQLRAIDKSMLKAYIGILKSIEREALYELLQSVLSE
jgi:mRNA interferase MazF